MNYYKHHIGDFDADTAHLSWLEDAAYRRLLCLYYRREQPIPADFNQACRLVRAVSKAERDAVEVVLNEFFKLTDEGWRQGRCDGEIELAQAKIAANRTNGKNGGRPRKSETQPKPTGFPEGTQVEPKQNLLHSPYSISQKKQKQKPPSAAPTAAVGEPPEWVPREAWAGFDAMRRRERHPLTPRAATLIWRALDRFRAEGHDPGEVLDQSTRNGWRDVFPIRARAGPEVPRGMEGVVRLEQLKTKILEERRANRLAADGDSGGAATALAAATGEPAADG